MKPGDVIVGEDGTHWQLGELLASAGKPGCQDPRCSRLNGECVGYHCPHCGEPCSSQGHFNCPKKEAR